MGIMLDLAARCLKKEIEPHLVFDIDHPIHQPHRPPQIWTKPRCAHRRIMHVLNVNNVLLKMHETHIFTLR